MKNMITILVLLCVAVGCSSNKNLKTANKTTSINGDKSSSKSLAVKKFIINSLNDIKSHLKQYY